MEAVKGKTDDICRSLLSCFVKGSPPEPCEEVLQLFASLNVHNRQRLMMYSVFLELRQREVEGIVRTAIEIEKESVQELVLERRKWVEDLLVALLQLGGCDDEEDEMISWDNYLYILLHFCSLSKVELCQALFLLIMKKMDSDVHHYLTMQQLTDFYAFYGKCSVTSFNTRAVDFTKLPLRRYYVEDFVELVQRFTVLLNPTTHLQRSLQEFLPSVTFWDNHHRSEVINRKITCDFFKIEKSRCFLWGEPPYRESCDMLAPEALGFQACNKDQWDLRTFDLHERIGAISDAGSLSRDGKLMAPPGFQYRSLKQFSVWGEQPNPEETERIMMESDENVYISSTGHIARKLDRFTQEETAEEAADKNKQKLEENSAQGSTAKGKEQKKKKLAALAVDEAELDFLADPTSACLRGACLDESFNPPPTDMPPSWMKRAAIAPAPRRLGPDPPLRPPSQAGNSFASGFWNSQTSFNNQTGGSWGTTAMTTFGKSQAGGQSPNQFRDSKVKFSDV